LTRDQRRLAAIVSADVVGYSLLMGRDDSATLAGLKAHRRELIDPKIHEYGGRIVKTTGDGLLLEFPSVVDAVRCAVDVQREMARRNAGIPPDLRIDFRVGINVGDIIIDGDDIFGDGVNVAARLEALAEPGGIWVSKVVRDQVLDKLSFRFEDLGAQEVKNIARPIEVYRVDLGRDEHQSGGQSGWLRNISTVPRRRLAAAVLIAGTAGVALWAVPRFWNAAPAPPPPAMSIAVLPFSAASDSTTDAYFAAQITQAVTSSLERTARYATITSYGLASTYAGKPVDARRLGQELNVRYLVDGSISRHDGQAVIAAQLIDASDGKQDWSDHLEAKEAQIAVDQSALVGRLTVALRTAMGGAELRRTAGPLPAGASALDMTLHAYAQELRAPDVIEGALTARKQYDEALRLDPSLVFALDRKAGTIERELEWNPRSGDRDALIRELDSITFRALTLDDKDPRMWVVRASALVRQQRWEAALEANARAQKIDASRVGSIGQRAEIMVAMGQPGEALALVDQGLSLQPPDAAVAAYLMGSRCHANMALGRYDDAIAACESEASLADSWEPHVYLVAAYALNANVAKTQAEKAKLKTQRPGFSIADFQARRISDVPAYLQQTEMHSIPACARLASLKISEGVQPGWHSRRNRTRGTMMGPTQ